MIIKINDNYYIKNNLYFDILKTKNYHNVFDNEKIIKPVSLRQENLVYFNLNKYPNDNYLINLKINLLNQINNLYDIYPRESQRKAAQIQLNQIFFYEFSAYLEKSKFSNLEINNGKIYLEESKLSNPEINNGKIKSKDLYYDPNASKILTELNNKYGKVKFK